MADGKFNRRSFLKGAMAAGGVALAAAAPVKAGTSGEKAVPVAMMIDLTRCDGCPARGTPACVAACSLENASRFPEPEDNIKDYWPQKKHEDWSGKRDLTSTLTPYNWTFVQKVKVEHDGREETVNVPRHCMHCDNPPCVNLCPVGANTKEKNGAVLIDSDLCLGGAKCRSVCSWSVPQRQAGVGLYLNFDPMAGGGVMYKCDLCSDRLKEGREPACVEACGKVRGWESALHFGTREEIVALARKRAGETGGHLYGLDENGGTSTIYVSKVPFEKIDQAMVAKKDRFRMPVKVKNVLEKDKYMMQALLTAPVAGLVAGAAAAGKGFFKAVKADDASAETGNLPEVDKTTAEDNREEV